MMEGKAATRSTKKYLTTKETLTNGRHKVTLAYEYTEEFREFRRGRWIDIRDLTNRLDEVQKKKTRHQTADMEAELKHRRGKQHLCFNADTLKLFLPLLL